MIESPGPVATAARRAFRSKVDSIRTTYGFEDVSLAPGTDTIEPADVELGQTFCGIELAIPILAAAMDAVVDVRLAGVLSGLGGLAVLNLEGIWTRYEDADEILERIAGLPKEEATREMQEIYLEPVKEELIARSAAAVAGHETDPCPLDHPLVGRLRCGEWLLFAGVHDVMHLEQLHAIASRFGPTRGLALGTEARP